jgi:hypothetical protein
MNIASEVTVGHTKLQKYFHVREVPLPQARGNRESALRPRDREGCAKAFRWTIDHIIAIDDAPGSSAAMAAHLHGLLRPAADLGLGQVGMVMAREVSSLARGSADWHSWASALVPTFEPWVETYHPNRLQQSASFRQVRDDGRD